MVRRPWLFRVRLKRFFIFDEKSQVLATFCYLNEFSLSDFTNLIFATDSLFYIVSYFLKILFHIHKSTTTSTNVQDGI